MVCYMCPFKTLTPSKLRKHMRRHVSKKKIVWINLVEYSKFQYTQYSRRPVRNPFRAQNVTRNFRVNTTGILIRDYTLDHWKNDTNVQFATLHSHEQENCPSTISNRMDYILSPPPTDWQKSSFEGITTIVNFFLNTITVHFIYFNVSTQMSSLNAVFKNVRRWLNLHRSIQTRIR